MGLSIGLFCDPLLFSGCFILVANKPANTTNGEDLITRGDWRFLFFHSVLHTVAIALLQHYCKADDPVPWVLPQVCVRKTRKVLSERVEG